MFNFICPLDCISLCVGVLERMAEAVVCCHGSSILKVDHKFFSCHLFIFLIDILSVSMSNQCAQPPALFARSQKTNEKDETEKCCIGNS